MGFRKASLGAMLALSMVSTPVVAQASAVSLSTEAAARSGAEMADANELAGGWIIPLLAILAIIAGILAATSGDDSRPTSP